MKLETIKSLGDTIWRVSDDGKTIQELTIGLIKTIVVLDKKSLIFEHQFENKKDVCQTDYGYRQESFMCMETGLGSGRVYGAFKTGDPNICFTEKEALVRQTKLQKQQAKKDAKRLIIKKSTLLGELLIAQRRVEHVQRQLEDICGNSPAAILERNANDTQD